MKSKEVKFTLRELIDKIPDARWLLSPYLETWLLEKFPGFINHLGDFKAIDLRLNIGVSKYRPEGEDSADAVWIK